MNERGYKPDSVPCPISGYGGDHSSGGQDFSSRSGATYPGVQRGEQPLLPYLVLLRMGFALPRPSPDGRCALTTPFHPYRLMAGGLFSVALSVRLPCLEVIQHPALWSPDFPRPAFNQAAAAFPASFDKYRDLLILLVIQYAPADITSVQVISLANIGDFL